MTDNPHSAEYLAYLNSAAWLRFRERVVADRNNRCEDCGADGNQRVLQVHHLTYERLGRERLTDVKLLCIECHEIADLERAFTLWYKGRLVHRTRRDRKRKRTIWVKNGTNKS